MNRPYPLYTLPQITSLRQMIEIQAKENPNRIAFRFREGKMIIEKTALEFQVDINTLENWFYSKRIRNSHVALIAPNSYIWLVIWFAVICSNNVIVPIDHELPPDEFWNLIQHSECSFVFTDERTLERLGTVHHSVTVTQLKTIKEIIDKGECSIRGRLQACRNSSTNLEDLATIVYTSGTTGDKKGVMLSQLNIVSNINQCCKYFKPGPDSISVLPFHHLFGLVPSLIMFFNYQSTVFINTGLKNLTRDFELAKPETTMLVPLHIETFYKRIIQAAKKDEKEKKLRCLMRLSLMLYSIGLDVRKPLMRDVRKYFGGNLQTVLVGGAALNPFYQKEYRAWGIDLIGAYGATECSPGIAVNRNNCHKDGSAGLPIPGCEVCIAEDGEILIRGKNVMIGYYKDERSSSDVLVDGWYYTGDLGYLDSDGFLFITGRKKNLIILSNGENVSPEGLEKRISEIPGVSEVLVYAKGDDIIAEIFPEEAYDNQQIYFEDEVHKLNNSLSISHRIRTVKLRHEEFSKNATQKILRRRI